MQLIEKHVISNNHQFYKEIDGLSFASKNLYNKANYFIRNDYFNKLKENNIFFTNKYLSYFELFHILKNTEEYKALPAKVSNSVLQVLDKNWKSFIKAVCQYYKTPKKFKRIPKLPQYKDKIFGRNIVIYDKQALLKKYVKDGFVGLSKSNIKISTRIDFNSINQIRLVPKNNEYNIEVVYSISDVDLKLNNQEYLAIDIGLNNLATCVNNTFKLKPFIINGRPLKSINQYYNKKLSEFKSKLKGDQKTCNRIKKLTSKRNAKIADYLHKSSRYIINQLVSYNINTLIVGKNDGWKQDISIGKRNNQNFVSVPHANFIEMLRYKCSLKGVNFILTEESYTSKCSFIDNESLCSHKKNKVIVDSISGNLVIKSVDDYVGDRVERGLFRSATGIEINADVNGALNILRKVVPEFNILNLTSLSSFGSMIKRGIEGLSVSPSIINIVEKKLNICK